MIARFHLPVSAGVFLLASSQLAFAHVGHLGELAGHSHWIGAAALGGAAALAVWLAARSKKRGEHAVDDSGEEAESKPEETVES